MKFTVWTEGDRTVGDYGHVAHIDFPYGLAGHSIETMKGLLAEHFEEIWMDDVKVALDEELNDDAHD